LEAEPGRAVVNGWIGKRSSMAGWCASGGEEDGRPQMDWALGKRWCRKKINMSLRGEEEGMAGDGEEGAWLSDPIVEGNAPIKWTAAPMRVGRRPCGRQGRSTGDDGRCRLVSVKKRPRRS
jgi:hypothetical protein